MNESNGENDELLPDALVTAEVLNLRSELGRARRTIRQREEALAVLNRRLVTLENGEPGSGGPLGETAGLTRQLAEANEQLAQITLDRERLDWAQAEVLRLQASKMFRYTWPVRRVLSAMRTK